MTKNVPPVVEASNNAAVVDRIDTLTAKQWEMACAVATELQQSPDGIAALREHRRANRDDFADTRACMATASANARAPVSFNPLLVPEAIRGENNLAPDGSGSVLSELEELARSIAARTSEVLLRAAADPSTRGDALDVMRAVAASFGDFYTFSRSRPTQCSTAWAMLWLEASAHAIDRVLLNQHGWPAFPVDLASAAELVAAIVRDRISDGGNGLSVREVPIDLRSRTDFCELFALASLALRAFRRGETDSVRHLALNLSRVIVPPDAWPKESAFADVLSGRTALPDSFDSRARGLARSIADAVAWTEFARRENATGRTPSSGER